MEERLHKVLAHSGVGSRRQCEELIEQGRVQVNGETVTRLGTKVDPAADEIRVDGERVRPEEKVYYLVYKPRGFLSTTRDVEGRPRVVDLVPETAQRIYTVGRLDRGMEGLMLLTNDGDVANVIAHPRYGIQKTYVVSVKGPVEKEQVKRIEEGVWLAEGKTSPARVRSQRRRGSRTELTIQLLEGRNREVRRMLAKVGLRVDRLVLTAIGPLNLQGMRPGDTRRLPPRALSFARRRAREERERRE